VLSEILRDKIFYETSGGGVTLSGGEPLFQPEFSAKILNMCKAHGIHTAIETCGFANESALRSVIQYCDLVLFDIKETDEELHLRYTKAPLKPILRNLAAINEMQIPFIIRAPLIPTLNDREDHIRALMDIRLSMEHCQGIEIMPYHNIGAYKYALLGRGYECADIIAPNDKLLLDLKSRLC
jgi:pyruvate formate lyase activating enzyme